MAERSRHGAVERGPRGLGGVLEHRQPQRAELSRIGATLPNRCTAMIAFVRGVRAARTVSAVTQNVCGSTSQKTGTAPALTVASAVA